MIALVRKPAPMLPLDTPCVECGTSKAEHKKINGTLRCFPLVLNRLADRLAAIRYDGDSALDAGHVWRLFR